MEFGYFTLSDNHYPNNARSANQFVLDIREQAILADKIGMHSCWIGEHHFDSLGVNSRPDLLLANIAAQTKNVRLAPAVCVKPLQKPLPFYVASFSKTSLDMAAKRGLNIIYAPFASGMVFGGLDKAVDSYREACAKAGKKPGHAMCSYFIYIADDAKGEDYGRQMQMDYFNHCVIQAFPQKPEDAPPTMQYFMKIVDILKNMKKEDLSERSILLGSPEKITETLKKVEKSGVEEVILYFNVGNKPHNLVKEQMHRFMQEIAPNFQGKHIERMRVAA